MNRRMMRWALLMLLAAPGEAALAERYAIDARHTFPGFEVSHIGFSTQRGRFNRTEGTIVLDRVHGTGSIEVRIDADSIDTGLEELETRLKKEDFFNTARYTSISFKADQMTFAGDAPASATGVLTLLGVSKPLRLDISHFHCGVHPINNRHVCGADVTGKIKRSDFGMNAFLPAIGDEVTLRIQVEGILEP